MKKGIEPFDYSKHDFSGVLPAIVCARWNEQITSKLLAGAVKEFSAAGTKEPEVIYVPGCFEIPQVCKKLIDAKKYGAICALGCIIRGETTHHTFLADYIAASFARIVPKANFPVTLGILTVENKAQAEARSDKGVEAASAALELVSFFEQRL